jgi:hypothetical protein
MFLACTTGRELCAAAHTARSIRGAEKTGATDASFKDASLTGDHTNCSTEEGPCQDIGLLSTVILATTSCQPWRFWKTPTDI